MPQVRVNIPSVGIVNFPDTMSPEEISREALRLHADGVRAKGGDPSGRANTPQGPKAASVEFALGAAEALGFDLERPVTGTVRNYARGVQRIGQEILGTGPAAHEEPLPIQIVRGALEGPREAIHGFQENDYTKAAHGMGRTIGLAGAMLAGGTKRGRAATSTAIEKVAHAPVAVKDATTQLSGAAVEMLTKIRNPTKAMIVAIKPRSTNLRFPKDLDMALPEIKAVEPQLGRPISGLDDLMEGIPLAKRSVRSQYDTIAGPQRLRGIDGSPIADAIEKSIDRKVALQNPDKAAEIQRLADTYRRTFMLEELEDFLTTTNAQLEAHYGKYPAAQRSQLARDPSVAFREAEARALRDTIYKSFDAPGGGTAPRELQRRYGALMNLERETQRRRNVAQRQQFDSLNQQITKVQAAIEMGKAAGELMTAQPFKAGSRLMGAYAGRKAAQMVREQNTADALIRGVFANFKRTPAPITVNRVEPRGLLSPGPIVTPPPADTSYVRGVPAELAKRRLLLPERAGSPFVTPPPRESAIEYLRRIGAFPKGH